MSLILDDSVEIKRIVYDEETIRKRVRELGERITEDYRGKELVVVGVIKGSMYFFSDLTRAIDLPIKIDMIGFGNIPDTTSKTGVVRITKDIDTDITDKHVIIVEDVIRTGLTTAYLSSNLESKKPKEIALCTMLLNPNRLLTTIPVKYYGFEINDSWLLGYGMDKKEVGRNLPYIAELMKKE
ncbi:MAG: hypoxanthine phosphoribosyltransferase [Clostridiales bacterium]|nr:hypoxanthine phosphoribosyltransferase [Clostridiales bacterium]HAW15571.1 hypoxanthine phosphoribosyltransferase [Clostridiales bacterium]